MVTLTIDNRPVTVPEGTTILDAAKTVDIHIPTLCYLKDINEIAACRVCLVEIEGIQKLVAACNNDVWDGMVVYTNSTRVRNARRDITIPLRMTACNNPGSDVCSAILPMTLH